MKLLSSQRVNAQVDFFGLALQDADDAWLPALFPEGFIKGPFMSELPGRLDFTSAGHTQTLSIDVEIWTEIAPEPDGSWEETAIGRVECRSGELRFWSATGGPAVQSVILPRTIATNWRVRANCRGREAAAQACLTGVPHGVEQYLLQFWAE